MERSEYDALLDDLEDEEQVLDELVAGLDEAGWAMPTPAEGWTIRHQIGHLAATEGWARRSLEDPDGFRADVASYFDDPEAREEGLRDGLLGRTQPASLDTLAWWREDRRVTNASLRSRSPSDRVPWFGPDMSVASFATARVMETWAHGQDVADALGVERIPTRRLRHVVGIGVRARPYSYVARGRDVPPGDVHVDVVGPDGDHWTWGPEDATSSVTGDALELCLVVTQRRNPADTALVVTGDLANEWIGIAQAFAGPATEHRPATNA